ncbi:MAG: maleylpyruvate isomerase family mycothiol-dependent enzyme [Mycolicibacterium cosmeticum]|nr:maleylpyruvate isomerase family mycothiol-dependent enzyme [Mycolicibacterium cosmeticum]
MSAGERLRANDERLLGVLAALTADDWAAPSLCAEWSNHEVLAHLVVGYGCGIGEFAAELVRRRAFDPANTALAVRAAARRSPQRLLDDLARLIAVPKGLGRTFPRSLLLGDHVTHELDIVHALRREPRIPTDALTAVLNTQVALPNPFVPAYRLSRGLRLVATDAQWTHGTGPTVTGRAADLVSVLGNRPCRLGALGGDGVAALSGRVRNRTDA